MEPGDTLEGFGESRLVEVRSSGETQGSQVVPGSKVSVMVLSKGGWGSTMVNGYVGDGDSEE